MNNNGKRSIICASLALPLALLVSSIVAWYLKANNPDNVDITAGLAYLRPILVSSFITFLAFMLVAAVSALRGRKRDASPELSKLGLLLVIVLTVLSLSAAMFNKAAGSAEDNYRDAQSKQLQQQR